MFNIESVVEISKQRKARAGFLTTAHGKIPTPIFMPVATRAALRTMDSRDLKEVNTQMAISNAFLLSLRPGNEIFKKCGGIHKFMNWDRALVTDSGGFQMIRSGFLKKLTDRGIELRSPYDGSPISVTPEDVINWMDYQRPDIGMMLDDLPPFEADRKRNIQSVKRTISWVKRGFEEYHNLGLKSEGINIFPILQGGVDKELRKKCIEGIAALKPQGFGIGGLSIGESREQMMEIIDFTNSLLPDDKPVYLMGVGSPLELLDSIARGVDIFDSVFPARHARHKTVITGNGSYNLKKSENKDDFKPLEEGCKCPTCRNYTRAYLHHLLKTGEFGWMRQVSIHNLFFTSNLVGKARTAIKEDRFDEFRREFRKEYLEKD